MPDLLKRNSNGAISRRCFAEVAKEYTKGTNACAGPAERAEIIAFAYKRADS